MDGGKASSEEDGFSYATSGLRPGCWHEDSYSRKKRKIPEYLLRQLGDGKPKTNCHIFGNEVGCKNLQYRIFHGQLRRTRRLNQHLPSPQKSSDILNRAQATHAYLIVVK